MNHAYELSAPTWSALQAQQVLQAPAQLMLEELLPMQQSPASSSSSRAASSWPAVQQRQTYLL